MKKIDAVCIGDACIDDYLPPVGRRFVGGSALNTAVHMRLAAGAAAFVGAVGDDADGQEVIGRLKDAGVDVVRVQVHPGRTASVGVHVGANGERHFDHASAVQGPPLLVDEALLEFLTGRRLVHNTWLGGTEAHLSALRSFPGPVISMDYGSRLTSSFIGRTIEQVDIAFFSMERGQASEGRDLAAAAASRGPGLVVVTLGRRGALAYSQGDSIYLPAAPADVVDTLGAGDAFIGAFLSRWLDGEPLNTVMESAAGAAARACGHLGAWENAEIA